MPIHFLLLALLSSVPDPQPGHFVCDVGPVQKHIGESDWSVYSCHDGSTLLFSASGIYFEISILNKGIERGGESAAGKDKIDPAFVELSAMPHEALVALMAETTSAK